MEQFKQFSIEKQAAIDTLGKLHGVLDALCGMGVDVDSDLQKIASAMQAVESDVLRIALLGAFSDGKTSVIAAGGVDDFALPREPLGLVDGKAIRRLVHGDFHILHHLTQPGRDYTGLFIGECPQQGDA